MGKQRGQMDFGDELDLGSELEKLSAVQSESKSKAVGFSEADKRQTQKVAKESGFQSRQPQPERTQRRYRTGRNAQLNIKVTPETMQAFYAIADKKGWVLGEAMEKAVLLLEKEYGET